MYVCVYMCICVCVYIIWSSSRQGGIVCCREMCCQHVSV